MPVKYISHIITYYFCKSFLYHPAISFLNFEQFPTRIPLEFLVPVWTYQCRAMCSLWSNHFPHSLADDKPNPGSPNKGCAGHKLGHQSDDVNELANYTIRTGRNNVRSKAWRKLHNTHLQSLCSSPDITRVTISMGFGWERHVAGMGKLRNAHKYVIPKTWREQATWRKWYNNMKMELKYMSLNWIHVVQHRVR